MKRYVAMALVVVAIAFGFAGSASANVIVLDFEGINATYPSGFAFVQNFYNGGISSDNTSGPNYGIGFSDTAQAICLNTIGVSCSNTSRGGQGNPASDKGALFFLSGGETFMNVAAGFDTGFAFNYTAINVPGSVSVYTGLNGTGTLLATLALPTTPSGPCVGYGAGFCPFFPIGVGFSGTAESVSFAGVADQIVFDDVTFGAVAPPPVPEPATLLLLGSGLVGMAGLGWKRNRQ